MTSSIRLIVGLGNPGADYYQTRHNAGEDFVEAVARSAGVTLSKESKYFGRAAKAFIGNRPVWLLIPETFMNRSGKSVAALANFYKIEPDQILVAHDELDLDPGIAKLKIGGGHGGHNGLKDIIASLANNRGFARLRLGIGHPGQASQVSNYVLKKAPKAEFEATEDASARALAQLELVVAGDMQNAMQRLHSA